MAERVPGGATGATGPRQPCDANAAAATRGDAAVLVCAPPDAGREMEAPRAVPRLFGVVDLAVARAAGRDPVGLIAALADAGCPALIIRHRAPLQASDAQTIDAMVRLARYSGARVCLALSEAGASTAGADGRHLSVAQVAAGEARAAGDSLLGASVHSAAELDRATRAGADYVFAAPVYATLSKPGGETIGADGLAALCRSTRLPVIALGGVTPERVAEAVAAGAHGVAALHPFVAEPPREAVAAYLRALRRAPPAAARLVGGR